MPRTEDQVLGAQLRKEKRDCPGGPVAKTVLPKQWAQVGSLVRELDCTCCN